MRRHLIILLLLSWAGSAFSQTRKLNPDDFVFPVLNVAGYCSANFAEMRPDHFHSGVDIKTDGVEGKPVVAVADGYVSRIVVSPSGYGRALYITHPNGTMSVYGHLSAFRADIDSLVEARRYRTRRNAVDIYCDKGQFDVRQGERIALSGNTGNSFGPHLHFEIRDLRDNATLNLIRQGVIRVADDIPPRIEGLWYTAIDSAGIVPVRTEPRRIEVVRTSAGRYTVPNTVAVAPRGYFIIETTDRKNDVTNRYGIWRATVRVDDRTVYEYRADGFRFDETRYCNTVAYYPKQLTAKCEVISLAKYASAPRTFYPEMVDNGVVSVPRGERRRMNIEIEDDCGNISTLDFEILSTLDGPALPGEEEDRPVIDCRKPFTATVDDLTVTLPENSLYESAFFVCRRSERQPAASAPAAVTPFYEVMNGSTPLHKAATIAVRAYLPRDLQPYAVMGRMLADGKIVSAGGKWRDGAVETQSTKLGTFGVVLDTIAPVIRPRFNTDLHDMSGMKSIAFAVSDNFSGIRDFTATIDGEWVPLEYLPVKGTVQHRFDHRLYGRGRQHTLVLTVTDNCGNRSVKKVEFFR